MYGYEQHANYTHVFTFVVYIIIYTWVYTNMYTLYTHNTSLHKNN